MPINPTTSPTSAANARAYRQSLEVPGTTAATAGPGGIGGPFGDIDPHQAAFAHESSGTDNYEHTSPDDDVTPTSGGADGSSRFHQPPPKEESSGGLERRGSRPVRGYQARRVGAAGVSLSDRPVDD